MKKPLLILASILLLSGCYQQTADLTKPVQDLSKAAQQINQKIDVLSERVNKLESGKTEQSFSIPDGWVEYVNTDFGYSVYYPSGWHAGVYGSVKSTDFTPFYAPDVKGDNVWAIQTYDTTKKSIDGLITLMMDRQGPITKKSENIVIDTVPAVKVTVTAGGTTYPEGWMMEAIFLTKNNTIYEISGSNLHATEFETFYKSFKFIDNSQRYTNISKDDFEILFPDGWVMKSVFDGRESPIITEVESDVDVFGKTGTSSSPFFLDLVETNPNFTGEKAPYCRVTAGDSVVINGVTFKKAEIKTGFDPRIICYWTKKGTTVYEMAISGDFDTTEKIVKTFRFLE